MTDGELATLILTAAGAAGAAAAAAVRVLDKLIDLVGHKKAPETVDVNQWRRDVLDAISQQTEATTQLRLELKDATHNVLSALHTVKVQRGLQ